MAGATWWSWGFTKVRGWWVQWRFQQLHEIVIHKYDIGFTTVHLFIRDLNRHRKTLQRNPDQTTPLGRRIMLIDPGRSFNAQMVKWSNGTTMDNTMDHLGLVILILWTFIGGNSDFMNIYKPTLWDFMGNLSKNDPVFPVFLSCIPATQFGEKKLHILHRWTFSVCVC